MIRGIRYYSMLEASGYGLSALEYLAALSDAGVAVDWQPLAWNQNRYRRISRDAAEKLLRERRYGDPTLCRLIGEAVETSHQILHTVPEYWPELISPQHRNIGYTAWETDQMPDHWPQLLKSVDSLMVPSSFTRNVFLKSQPALNINVVPHIVRPIPAMDAAMLAHWRARWGIPQGHRVFYSINTWNARKNIPLLLHCYQLCFTASDPVTLILKTSSLGVASGKSRRRESTANLLDAILSNYESPANVILLNDESLSSDAMSALHHLGDIYLSLTHGEAWGMGTAQAIAQGKPVLITGWSGHLDFLGADYPGLVDFELTAVVDLLGSGSFQGHQNWAEVDAVHAMTLIAEVQRDYAGFIDRAARPTKDMDRFQPGVVAHAMIRVIES